MMNQVFNNIWLIDFEFHAPPGERPRPLCMVGIEFKSRKVIRLWEDELLALTSAPFPISEGTLVVAFFASAEFGCFLGLNWPMPACVVDLYAEFRCQTSGLPLPYIEATGKHRRSRASLFAALCYYGIGGFDVFEKESMRALAMRGGPYSTEEKEALLNYCQSDVEALTKLFERMEPMIDWPRAPIRGRYTIAVARMEWIGVPIDAHALDILRQQWVGIRRDLIDQVDAGRGVYQDGVFKRERWLAYVRSMGIDWPLLSSGIPVLDEKIFREVAKRYPIEVGPYRDLRDALSQMRLHELAVGKDSRNRCLLSPFASKTGRNQPSSVRFIFGPATWLRGLIRPERGMAVSYVDYEQQEFGIVAALSRDSNMIEAYRSGDPYLAFAVMAGAAPPTATKQTHAGIREQFKTCALAVLYGMGSESLASKLGIPVYRAGELIQMHRTTFPQYWTWSDAVEAHGILQGRLQAAFGWSVRVTIESKTRSLRNFPAQANGSEMLRLACIFATEAGIRVCAPVHDALLVEGAVEGIESIVEATQCAMAKASALVLDGFELRTEVKIVRWPDRYMDPRGREMWDTVWQILGTRGHSLDQLEMEEAAPVLLVPPHACRPRPFLFLYMYHEYC